MKWIEVTDYFSESQRHYKDKYLIIDEVLDDTVEVSLFSSPDGVYEIYVSYAGRDGIVYVNEADAYLRREEIKRVLAEDYQKNKKPSNEFIVEFADKYKLEIPFDLYFDDSALFLKTEENLTGFSFLFRTLYYNKDSDCGKRRKKRND